MSERIDSIVTGANEVVSTIYEKIGQIDNCKAVLKDLGRSEVALILSDGVLADLKNALRVEQMADLLYNIRTMLYANIDSAAAYLERLTTGGNAIMDAPVIDPEEAVGPATEPEPEEPAAEPTVPDVVKNYATKKQPKMTVETVAQMLRDGYSTTEISTHFGYKTTLSVDRLIKENKLNVKNLTQGNEKAKELTEADIPQIRALYTNGPMNLTNTAAELGTTKKILREFVLKHQLVKPVR